MPNIPEPEQSPSYNRRTLLMGAMFATFAAVLYQFGNLLFSFFKPLKKTNSFGGIVKVGTIADLPLMNSAPKLIPEGRFWLIHDQEGVFALHSSCTHLECRFSWDAEKNNFVCPCHGSEFTKKGTVLNGPASRDLDRFPVQLFSEDGELLSPAPGEKVSCTVVRKFLEGPKGGTQEGTQKIIYVRVDTGTKIKGKEHELQS